MPPSNLPDARHDRRYVAALARGLELLQCFRYGERWLSHHEITRRSGLPKATVSRLAYTLQQLGYLTQNNITGEYGLGAGGLTLGFRVLAHVEVSNAARAVMEELASHSGVAVALGVRQRTSMVYVAHSRGRGRLKLALDVGARIPIADTSMGRAFLCELTESRRALLYRQLEEQLEGRWAEKRTALDNALTRYRRDGYVASVGEWEPDVSAVGAAIDLGDGREPYGISIGGPSAALTQVRLVQDLGPRLVDAARRIQAILRQAAAADLREAY